MWLERLLLLKQESHAVLVGKQPYNGMIHFQNPNQNQIQTLV